MTDPSDLITRRAALGGVAAVGAGAVLAACGSDEPSDSAGDADDDSGSGAGSGGATGAGGGALATTADVPVGGGTVFRDAKVVVTQPTEGDFKAFSAVCTHQGCVVASVKGDTIQCNCHGSQYSASDGSVKQGPATKALAEKKVTIDGDSLDVS